MRTSVIIVNFNNKSDLQRCLPSVLISLSVKDELIVVDNSSTDNSIEWLEENYPEIQLLKNQSNIGFAGGNNIGVDHATGEYIAFLNPDTTVDPLWLESLLHGIESNPQAGLVTSKILMLDDPEIINTCGADVHISGITLCKGLNSHADTYQTEMEVNAVSGAGFLIRKDFFNKLGGFDEDFFMYMEDTDLSWRARLAGKACFLVPSSVIYHDYKLQFGPRKVFYQERNRYLMHLKSLEWKTITILIPVYVLTEIITWGFVILRDWGNRMNKIQAYKWISKNWKEIMLKRLSVQKTRAISDKELLSDSTYQLEITQTGDNVIARLTQMFVNPIFKLLRSLSLLGLQS